VGFASCKLADPLVGHFVAVLFAFIVLSLVSSVLSQARKIVSKMTYFVSCGT